MLKRLRAATLTVVLLASLLFGAFQPAEAAGAEGLQCSVRSTGDQFLVGWSGATTTPDRFVVERRAFGNVHWRGRTGGSESSFTDGAAPSGSSSLTYWVKALDGRGRLLERAECSWNTVLRCRSFTDDEGMQVRWDPQQVRDGGEVVIRRAVRPGQVPWWRAKVPTHDQTGSYLDRPSPTGWAQYQLVVKKNGRVVDTADCTVRSCLLATPTSAPKPSDLSPDTSSVEPVTVTLPSGTDLVLTGSKRGYADGDGGVWFAAAERQGPQFVLVRQDVVTGELVRGPGFWDGDVSLLVTGNRVLLQHSPKGSYGFTRDVMYDAGQKTIETRDLALGASLTREGADGALLVAGSIHQATGLAYVPAGSDSAIWLVKRGEGRWVLIESHQIGTNNRVFFQKNDEWFVADMSCHT